MKAITTIFKKINLKKEIIRYLQYFRDDKNDFRLI